jgi:NAD(P)-dependent dehydrogenase (short-subunit alcohol dehydrogenase family)
LIDRDRAAIVPAKRQPKAPTTKHHVQLSDMLTLTACHLSTMKGRRTVAMGRLDGRIAIVTGGAKGIGRHYSRALAAEGARLMIADVVDGREIAKEIAGNYGTDSVASVITDVSDETAVISLVAQTIERFGKIDILVNNAAMFAVLHETMCTEIDVALWDRVMAVNLRGPFLMIKHVVPRMKARQYGKIINIGSGTAYRGVPMLLHYVTSKGGIVGFTRALSRELGEHGIRVNTLAPGFTLSDSIIQENPEHVRTAQPRAIAGRAIPRDEHPQDLLGALIFLASGESDFVTGQNIAVDGGNVNT